MEKESNKEQAHRFVHHSLRNSSTSGGAFPFFLFCVSLIPRYIFLTDFHFLSMLYIRVIHTCISNMKEMCNVGLGWTRWLMEIPNRGT